MVLWWIGNIIFLFVVIPLVVGLLNRLWSVVVEIKQYGDDALEHGQLLLRGMDGLESLLETRGQAESLNNNVQRYARALDALL